MYDINSLSFKQMVTLFVSLGPHKHRELARFAGLSHAVIAQWSQGTARPDPMSEPRFRHYLLSKLSDIPQLQLDHDAQTSDLQAAEAKAQRAASAWDTYIEDLREKNSPEDVIKKAEESKAQAVNTVRKRLGLV